MAVASWSVSRSNWCAGSAWPTWASMKGLEKILIFYWVCARPVFNDRDENCIVPPESGVGLFGDFSSPVSWHWPSQAGWAVWSPVVGTYPLVIRFKKRYCQPRLPLQKHCSCPPLDAAEVCQPKQPHNIKRLEVINFLPTSESNSPLGGDWLTAQPLSLPDCPWHTDGDQIRQQKIDCWPTSWGVPVLRSTPLCSN